jgi:tRNA 5-methylaminomethyl-2-thiouridine biosynthesis bifunctional protein
VLATKDYDSIVIGGGIAGCSVAYELNVLGHKVLLLEAKKIASGSSYAAGAFISPMLGLPNDNKSFVNAAFFYTTDFYSSKFPTHFLQKGVNRIPKDREDAKDFERYYQYIDLKFSKKGQGCFFKEGGIVDSVALCQALIKGIDTVENTSVDTIKKVDEYWNIKDFKANNIVFATGASTGVVDIPYAPIRGVWGERITIESSLPLPYNQHKKVSISAQLGENKIIIGATSVKNNTQKKVDNQAAQKLLESASDMIDFHEAKVIDLRFGMRPASHDYLPMVGALFDIDANIRAYPEITNGRFISDEKLIVHDGLYLHNGHGARGFVTAPYTAQFLAKLIVDGNEIPKTFDTKRLFRRWVKRIKQ